MIDTHCHLDLYQDPYAIAELAERSQVITIAVTNLPSAFEQAYPHVRGFRYIRLAVGLHPLMATAHATERDRFIACLKYTSYIGEVGLDFSPQGLVTRDIQIESFRFILQTLHQQPKYVTLHSRRAESVVLDLLEETGVGPVVFHWFSGSFTQLERLLKLGHMCSVNPAMLRSSRGKAIIERLPLEHILTETDGPFVSINGRPTVPTDVAQVEKFLVQCWNKPVDEVRLQLRHNLRKAIPGG